MKWYFYVFMGVFIFGVMGCRKEPNDGHNNEEHNVVFNPGFDMTPWDTGWTIAIDTSSQDGGYCDGRAIGESKSDTGMSSPNCCKLYTLAELNCTGWGSGGGRSQVTISQTFNGISDCRIKVYIKYWMEKPGFNDQSEATIQACVNNTWDTLWKEANYYTIDTIWSEVDTTIVNGTVSGIRFCAFSEYYRSSSSSGDRAFCNFWIDNVYVGK